MHGQKEWTGQTAVMKLLHDGIQRHSKQYENGKTRKQKHLPSEEGMHAAQSRHR